MVPLTVLLHQTGYQCMEDLERGLGAAVLDVSRI